MQRKGVRVSVVSSIRTSAADGRRRAAPPGRPVPGAGRHRAGVHPPADRAAARPAPVRQTPAEPFRTRAGSPDAGVTGACPEPPGARRTARCAPGWPRTGRATARRIRTGSTRRCRASGRSMRACWWSAWRPACAAPTAPGGRSPAISPGCCCIETLLRFGFAAGVYAAPIDDGMRAGRLPGDQRGALRAAGESAACRPRSHACNPFLAAEIAAMPRLRAVLALGGWRTRRCCAPGRYRWRGAAFRPWRGARAAGRAAAGRQLSCVALQHEHRAADRGDVRRGGGGGSGAIGRWLTRRALDRGRGGAVVRGAVAPLAQLDRATAF